MHMFYLIISHFIFSFTPSTASCGRIGCKIVCHFAHHPYNSHTIRSLRFCVNHLLLRKNTTNCDNVHLAENVKIASKSLDF